MIVAAGLVVGAIVLGWLAPWPLARYAGQHPQVWLTAVGAAGLSVVSGAFLLLAGSHRALADCWVMLGHTHVHPWDELAGAVLLAVVCLAAARVARTVRRSVLKRRRTHQAHLVAAELAALSDVDGVLWLDSERPFAYSIAGRPGLIVASTGLRKLPDRLRIAVLRHEREHLRGRHHALIMAVTALAETLPRVPLLRQTPLAVRTLTELAADAGAAERHGAQAVREALLAMSSEEDHLSLRLQHLQAGRPGVRLTAWATSAMMPVMAGTVAALAFLAC